MPRGSKAKYTDKQKRQAEHIEEGYKERGVSREATRGGARVGNRQQGNPAAARRAAPGAASPRASRPRARADASVAAHRQRVPHQPRSASAPQGGRHPQAARITLIEDRNAERRSRRLAPPSRLGKYGCRAYFAGSVVRISSILRPVPCPSTRSPCRAPSGRGRSPVPWRACRSSSRSRGTQARVCSRSRDNCTLITRLPLLSAVIARSAVGNGDILLADTQEATDADHDVGDLAALVEQQVVDVADRLAGPRCSPPCR